MSLLLLLSLHIRYAVKSRLSVIAGDANFLLTEVALLLYV